MSEQKKSTKKSGANRKGRRASPGYRHTPSPEETEPDYSGKCEVCGASPTMPLTGMCGPCTFGESETIDGNWQQ